MSSMRVGMPYAIDDAGTRHSRWAIDYQPRPFVGGLRCSGCATGVDSVVGYKPRGGTRRVDPLFRLQKHTAHEEDCEYDFHAQAGKLTVDYRSEIEKRGNHYTLILADPAPSRVVPTAEEAPADPRSRLDVRARPGAPRLHPTISAASAIARLLASFDNDPAARNAFRATYQGKTYRWEQIYFHAPHDTQRLERTVTSRTSRPLIVRGKVRTTGESSTGDTHFAQLITSSDTNAEGRFINVYLRSEHPEDVQFNIDDDVIAYGQWTRFSPPNSKRMEIALWCRTKGSTALTPDLDH